MIVCIQLRKKIDKFLIILKDKSRYIMSRPTAFVMINAEIGEEEEVLRFLKEDIKVDEAYVVYGVYDLVCKVSSDTMKNLKDMVINQIRQAKGVRSTLTMVIVSK
jgi:DNA-binding Lrp family transcriptional regulator